MAGFSSAERVNSKLWYKFHPFNLIRAAKAVAGAEPPKVRLKRQLSGETELHADPKRPGEADWFMQQSALALCRLFFRINKKTGKVTVKKKLKEGIYKVKVKVKAAGNSSYKAATKKVSITIKIK